jgi:hypothetical protein
VTGKPYWAGSTAQRLLKLDVDAGRHNLFTPKQLYDYRIEYRHFSLEVFRNHIYQEAGSRLQSSYWLNREKKAKKAAAKAKARTDV